MNAVPPRWDALAAATRCLQPRVPFVVDGCEAGSVALAHLDALRDWAPALRLSGDRVHLEVSADRRDAVLAEINAGLRARGLIKAWRDETYALPDPVSLRLLARIERASSRFWGTLTFGAHCSGWVAGADGRPARLWIAQRAFDKATDPGAYDNLVGGGVPLGQSAADTLVREGWEEAGLTPEVMHRATPGRVIRLRRDIPEGLQHEWIHSFDLRLQADETPLNQDGEVHAFRLHDAAAALALAAGSTMTVDSALVTLDFALRHRLFAADEQDRLEQAAAPLWVAAPP